MKRIIRMFSEVRLILSVTMRLVIKLKVLSTWDVQDGILSCNFFESRKSFFLLVPPVDWMRSCFGFDVNLGNLDKAEFYQDNHSKCIWSCLRSFFHLNFQMKFACSVRMAILRWEPPALWISILIQLPT